MWLEQNRLISIFFTVLTHPIAFIQTQNSPFYEICINSKLYISYRKEAVKERYNKKVRYTHQKSFKDSLDKLKFGGSYNVGIKGFGIGVSFEFSKTTHTKNSQDKTSCEVDTEKVEFQDGTMQIYKKTKWEWLIDGQTASHETDEYVDTQMTSVTCDVANNTLEAMAKRDLELATVEQGGEGEIKGNMYNETKCVRIYPSKPFQCDNFGDTTENAGRCSDVRDDTKAKKVKVCSQCPEKMSKESCNRACLDHSNRRTEMGCCAYEADTGYCFWDNEPLIEKNPGFTSVLCRKGVRCTVNNNKGEVHASECGLCPRHNKAWCDGSDCKWDDEIRKCYKEDIEEHDVLDEYYGAWSRFEQCDDSTYATGFKVKIDNSIRGDDNKGVLAIAMICGDKSEKKKKTLTPNSKIGTNNQCGSYIDQERQTESWPWLKELSCKKPEGYINAVDLEMWNDYQMGGRQGAKGMTNIKMICDDGTILDPMKENGNNKNMRGQWQGKHSCEDGTVVCGIRTKYNFDGETPGDHHLNKVGDCNLKVNDAKFKCCPKKDKEKNAARLISKRQPNPRFSSVAQSSHKTTITKVDAKSAAGKPRYEPSSVKISGRRVSCDVSRRDLDRSGLNDEEEGRFYDYDDPQYQELYSDEELSQLELDDYGEDYLENNPNDPLKTPIPKQECAVICNKLECSRVAQQEEEKKRPTEGVPVKGSGATDLTQPTRRIEILCLTMVVKKMLSLFY